MAADLRKRTLTTADLPADFRLDPADRPLADAARLAGLTVACGHADCLGRAVRRLLADDRAVATAC